MNIIFINEHKIDWNTQGFETNKNTFIANESSNNYEMFNLQSTLGNKDAINRLRYIENTKQ